MSEISVLHIDDSVEYLEFTRSMLTCANPGYSVESAQTVDLARQKLLQFKDRKKKYDVILMDYDLGCSTNGLELVRRFIDGEADALIIMLSAFEDEIIKKAAQSLGVSCFLTKKEIMSDCFMLHKVISERIS